MSGNAEAGVLDRRDVWLEDAFRVMTHGRLLQPNALQRAVFPRLTTQDTGLLIPTGPCAGRLEAIAIPSLVSMQVHETAHRLFIVGSDGCPLDDYMYRMSTYVQSLVTYDGVPRTIWFEEPERAPIARKYLPDGSLINGASDSPFDDEVDIVVMPFSHFRTVFFNAGGVHGVPEGIGFDSEVAAAMAPRGLFYFDEAFGATRVEQLEFVRMVEFLFAQDLDIVVGASSMPEALRDDLSFLELLFLSDAQREPRRMIEFVETKTDTIASAARSAVVSGRGRAKRVICALNNGEDTRLADLHAQLSELGETQLYRTSASRAERGQIYAWLKEAEARDESYVVVTDGAALEAADLDCGLLITEPCAGLSLVRRAGRCNRRDRAAEGRILVLGDPEKFADSRASPNAGGDTAAMYLAATRPRQFEAAAWSGLASPV